METAENEGSAWVPVLTSYNGEHHAHTARKGRYMKRVKTLIPGNKKKKDPRELAQATTTSERQEDTRVRKTKET